MTTDIEQSIADFTKVVEGLIDLGKTLKPGATEQQVAEAAKEVKAATAALKELKETLFRVQGAITVTQDVISKANRGLRALNAMNARNDAPTPAQWQELSAQVKGLRAQVQCNTVVEDELLGRLREIADDAVSHFTAASASPEDRSVYLKLLKDVLTRIRAYEDVLFVKLGNLMVKFN